MTLLHTEKTEAFYREVLKINLDAAMHSSRAPGLEEPLEQLRLEAEWSADEVAYGLEIRLADAQLARIEADVKAGCSMAELGSNETQAAIQDAWDDAGQINNVVVIEHDSLSIIQRILEDVASGKELSKGDREWAELIAKYLNSRYQAEGCWIETTQQKHDRFMADKRWREKDSSKEVVA